MNMKLRLTVIAGPDAGRTFGMESGQTLTVGRGEKSDFRLGDPSVSRVHFQLKIADQTVLIADQGSSSGTLVDGKNVDSVEIPIGTVIQIGDTRLRVDSDGSPDKTVVPAGRTPIAEVKPLFQLIGTELGPYKLTEIIGKGKSGMVFKAFDAEKNRDAAVKVLTPQFTANDEQRQRFVRAMKTMLPIKDPRIVRLYNAGINGPYCWSAMEYIEGENLAQLIERIGIDGMLDWKKVWRVAVDIAVALKTGFENSVVHRNVTPTNIIRRSSDEMCLLGDFMFAKALQGTLAQQVTQPGEILGDLAYLAPERTRADAILDTRSDIYGLGATCYALLTGRPPAAGSAMTEIIHNVREVVPPPPKSFQLSVDELFQGVVMKMLAKDPGGRFETPDQLIKELLRVGKFKNLDPKF